MKFKSCDNTIDKRTFRLISDLSNHEVCELAEDFAIETGEHYALIPVTKTEYKQIMQADEKGT